MIDRTERLANSLGKLCATVASLNDNLGSGKVLSKARGLPPELQHATRHHNRLPRTKSSASMFLRQRCRRLAL